MPSTVSPASPAATPAVAPLGVRPVALAVPAALGALYVVAFAIAGLGGLAVVAFAIAAWAIVGSLADLLLFAAVFAVFTLPGWPIARWLAGRRAPWLVITPLALICGYACGLLLFLTARLALPEQMFFVLVLTAGLSAVLALGLEPTDEGRIALPTFDWRDTVALSALLLVVVAIVGPVFANVGRPTPNGLAYRAYFIADLFAHMSVVAELTKPLSPPLNPYFATEPLPYYWSFFTLPTLVDAARTALRGPIGVDRSILLTDLTMAGVYVSVWFIALRAIGCSALGSALAWVTVLVASSFEGFWFLIGAVPGHRTVGEFRHINIDAVTRWIWDLPPVDGLHRLLWYTPQHGMAITLGLLAIVVGVVARRTDGFWRGVIDGLLLGTALACSSFNGLLLIGGYALAETWRIGRARFVGLGPWLIARAVAAAIVLACLALTVALGMIQRSAGELVLRWNPHFLRHPWMFVALSFGPTLLVAPFGVRRLRAIAPHACTAVIALSLVCAAAFLYVDVRGHDNTYVSFRTGQIWFLVLAMASAAAFDAARRWPARLRLAAATLTALAIAIAIPTVALDWFNARDISNTEMSVGGFPWTVHISPAQQAAAAWIDSHVRPASTVQIDARARGRSTWAFVPAFARRRLAVGLGLFEPNPRRFDYDIGVVRHIYRTTDVKEAFRLCEALRIEYLYVGPEERAAHGPSADKFCADPNDFTLVYDGDGVTIYHVRLSMKALRLGGRDRPGGGQ